MSYQFRPAVRQETPLIIGLAGPTKSGKTFSAHRLASGLAGGGQIVMLNAEGARGHQYADTFTYVTCDLVPPFRYGMYEEVLREAAALKPATIIIDSMSHAHDGPGGLLEWHEAELDRIAGKDYVKRDRANFTAWITPKAAENSFRYALLEMPCPVILCMRAKEKIKIITGRPPVDLGWQPIVGEGLAFETIFTLTLPPHSRGVPDLEVSELREPFDTLIPHNRQLDEDLGRRLAEWAKGSRQPQPRAATAPAKAARPEDAGNDHPLFEGPANARDRGALLRALDEEYGQWKPHGPSDAARKALAVAVAGAEDLGKVDLAALDDLLTLARDFRKDDAGAVARVMGVLRPKKA